MPDTKKGRPRGHVPGSRREGKLFRVRASIAEAQVIEDAARAAKVSVTDFFIKSALVAAAGLGLVKRAVGVRALHESPLQQTDEESGNE